MAARIMALAMADDSDEPSIREPRSVTSAAAPPANLAIPSALDGMSAERLACIDQMSTKAPDAPRETLLAFAEARNFDADLALAQYEAARRFRAKLGGQDVNRVAQYVRIPVDVDGPDGCLVCLEDGRDGVARDRCGRPIVVSIGLPYGSVSEMVEQLAYALLRAESHALPGQVPGEVCFVVEVEPRQGATATFRFVDKSLRAVLEVQRAYFPGSLRSSIHLCKVPRTISFAFRLARPFLDKRLCENLKLHTTFAPLDKFIARECQLDVWGGSFDFDHEAYLQWRSQQEGVKLTERLWRFTDEDLARAEAAWIEALSSQDSELGGVPAPALIAGPPRARRVGRVLKVGTGIWGSTRWSPKLMVLARGCAIYFDGHDEKSKSNRPKRVIPLSGALVRRQQAEEKVSWLSNAPKHRFEVLLATRTFAFGCQTATDLEEWLVALRSEITDAEENILGGAMGASLRSERAAG